MLCNFRMLETLSCIGELLNLITTPVSEEVRCACKSTKKDSTLLFALHFCCSDGLLVETEWCNFDVSVSVVL